MRLSRLHKHILTHAIEGYGDRWNGAYPDIYSVEIKGSYFFNPYKGSARASLSRSFKRLVERNLITPLEAIPCIRKPGFYNLTEEGVKVACTITGVSLSTIDQEELEKQYHAEKEAEGIRKAEEEKKRSRDHKQFFLELQIKNRKANIARYEEQIEKSKAELEEITEELERIDND